MDQYLYLSEKPAAVKILRKGAQACGFEKALKHVSNASQRWLLVIYECHMYKTFVFVSFNAKPTFTLYSYTDFKAFVASE